MKNIEFIDGNFDSIIVLFTKFNEIDLLMNSKVPILAADGAGLNLLENNIIPDFIIGDLDSFSPEIISKINFPKERLIQITEQETNDFEKTLKFAIEKGFKNILIIGIHGGDYEHSLNNWSVFSRFSKISNLTMLENGRYGFCTDYSFKMETESNELISLLPIKKSKVTTKGLKWQLNGEYLELGNRECHHNIALETKIEVSMGIGEIFVFCNSRYPKIRFVNGNTE